MMNIGAPLPLCVTHCSSPQTQTGIEKVHQQTDMTVPGIALMEQIVLITYLILHLVIY